MDRAIHLENELGAGSTPAIITLRQGRACSLPHLKHQPLDGTNMDRMPISQMYDQQKKKSKYNAKKVFLPDIGMYADSKKEAAYYNQLRAIEGNSPDKFFFLYQVPIRLPGKTKYVVDFMEFERFWSSDTGESHVVRFVDTKGYMTQASKRAIKQVEGMYPIKIEII